ncbi:NUDIX domain-containing protein [Candidatus Woesearchaeota archaeon]|nr:NUDIX domain-containing protein [Candidatus Woesearchaeota archaeon]
MKKEKSAGAVLFKNDKEIQFLLLHYVAGHWDFPKGHIEENETEEETVKREIDEETNIKNIQILEGFKEKFDYYFRFNDILINKEVVFFVAKTDQERVTLSEEHIGFEWLNYHKALERITFKNSKKILEKANKFIKKIIVS